MRRAIVLLVTLLATASPLQALAPLDLPVLPPPAAPPGEHVVTLLGPDGEEFALDLPAPLVRLEGPAKSVLVLDRDAGRRVDGRLLDVRALAEEGLLERDGVVAVIVATPSPEAVAPFLDRARPFPRLGLVAGDLALGRLPALAGLPEVERVWLDARVQATLADTVPLIRADEVHAEQDAAGDPVRGRGVKVAILDTGVDATHPDLGGCFGAGCKVAGGRDVVNGDDDPSDDHGHGTHVAATAAGAHGVAPDATILAYKVLDARGSGSWSVVIAGIEEAVAAGADVVSMSLSGFGSADSPVATTVDWAVDQGVVVVSAAGNFGCYACVGVPAAATKGIAVGASDKADQMAPFSARGPVYTSGGDVAAIKPDLVAPGVDVVAAVPTGACELCDPSGYLALSGTSMATPHVAGAAALLLQSRPSLAPAEVKAVLMQTAVRLGEDARTEGTGRVDAHAAWSADVAVLPGNAFAGLARSDAPFHSEVAYEVRDLAGAADRSFGLAHGGAFPAVFDPATVAVPAGGVGASALVVDLGDPAFPEGWAEGNVTAVDGATGATVASLRTSLLKTGVVRFVLGPDPLFVGIMRDATVPGEWPFFDGILFPSTEFNYTAIDGTYSFIVVYASNPSGFWEYRGQVRDAVVHEDSTLVDFRAEGTPHVVPYDVAFEDGTPLDASHAPCPRRSTGRCFELAFEEVFSTRFQFGFGLAASTFQASRLGDIPSSWSFTRYVEFRDGATTYWNADATYGVDASTRLGASAPYREAGARYNAAFGYPEQRILRECMSRYFGSGVSRTLPDEGAERWLLARDPVPWYNWTAPDGRAIEVDPVPCRLLRAWSMVGVFDADGFCVWGCLWVGTSLFADLEPDPFVQRTWWGADAQLYDDAFGRPGGDLGVFVGAPSFSGEVYPAADSFYASAAWDDRRWFTAGGGASQWVYQTYATALGYEVLLDDEVVASGPVEGGSVYVPFGTAGRAEGRLHFGGALVDDAVGSATYALAWTPGALTKAPPAVLWVRSLGDGELGARFDGAEAIEVVARVARADSARIVVSGPAHVEVDVLPDPDGLVQFSAGTLPTGTYSVEVSATDADGSVARLTQSPAFFVGEGTNAPPSLAIREPFHGAVVEGAFPVRVDASDPDGAVTSVQVRLDDDAWTDATFDGTYWRATLDATGRAAGKHVVWARATDGLAWTETSVAVEVVGAGASVEILAPADGSEHPALDLLAHGTATPSEGATLVVVVYRVDGGMWFDATGLEAWNATLDGAALGPGLHYLEVVAIDSSDARAYDAVTFSISDHRDDVRVEDVHVARNPIRTSLGRFPNDVAERRTVSVLVRNDGTRPAEFEVALDAESALVVPGTTGTLATHEAIGRARVRLAPGEGEVLRFTWDTTGNAGDQTLVARADPWNELREVDEGDNEARWKGWILVGGLGGVAEGPVPLPTVDDPVPW